LAPKNTNGDAIKFWSEFLKEYLKDTQVQKQFIDDLMVPLPFGADKFNKIVQTNKVKLLELKD
jgi:tripartite-type tricarboxylate transporter receptor subunit TctC